VPKIAYPWGHCVKWPAAIIVPGNGSFTVSDDSETRHPRVGPPCTCRRETVLNQISTQLTDLAPAPENPASQIAAWDEESPRPGADPAEHLVPVILLRDVGALLGPDRAGAVTLDVREDEFLCLVGPAGSGKTTMLRGLAGLERPAPAARGRNRRPAAGHAPSVGFMLAESTLFPWLTVRQNLWLPLRVGGRRKVDPWQVDALLGMLGLLEVANLFPADLPVRTRRLVELSRALVRDPSLVLIDEPFRGLDFSARRALADDLERVRAITRKTFMLFTRDITAAVHVADRVGVLSADAGRLLDVVNVALPRPRRAASPPGQAGVVQRIMELCGDQPRIAVTC